MYICKYVYLKKKIYHDKFYFYIAKKYKIVNCLNIYIYIYMSYDLLMFYKKIKMKQKFS